MKKAGKTAFFFIVSIIFIHVLNMIFTPKWEEDGLWEPATRIIDGFYAEEENTIDVIYLGSSNSFYDINPLVIYEEQEITGYVLGSGEQRLFTSYYYLQEALKSQKPKVVVLEALGLFYEGKGEEEQSRKAYDYMKLSGEKIQSLEMAAEAKEDIFSYAIPFFRYHARWSSLNERDFLYPFSDKRYFLKGYAFSEQVAEGLPGFDMERIHHPGIAIGEVNEYYFQQIKQVCMENHIALLLIKTPNIEWGMSEHTLTAELAERNDVPFYDYNTFMHELGIREETCFLDGAHLNYVGAEILSSHLGALAADCMEEIPEREEKIRRDWEKDLEMYREEVGKKEWK
ncbi:MAG: hypothetical protein NC412_03990 [Roseburia sp.]|nr:hypothetical protein [Roseburia sp.]MCM1278224.1 hypothetical protein [Robinsoniella sp.]